MSDACGVVVDVGDGVDPREDGEEGVHAHATESHHQQRGVDAVVEVLVDLPLLQVRVRLVRTHYNTTHTPTHTY